MKRKFFFAFITLLNGFYAFAQIPNGDYVKDSTTYIRSHSVDFKKLRLEVSFDVKQSIVKGKVTEYFTPIRKNVDTIFFNGPGIKIFSCTLNGKPALFDTVANGVYVHCNPALHWD